MRNGRAALARVVARLPFTGTTIQALKAALAAGIAWALGGLVPCAPPIAYLAPQTPMLTVQLTVAESVSGAFQRTAGAVVGVILAVLAVGSVGVTPLTIAALVLVAQGIGRVLHLTTAGTAQVITTAMLVLTIGGATSFTYGFGRVIETIVGGLVGIGINALLVPPSHLSALGAACRGVADALVAEMQSMAAGLADGLTHDMADERLRRAR